MIVKKIIQLNSAKNGQLKIKIDLKEGYKAKEEIDDVKDIVTKIKTKKHLHE